MNIIVVVVFVDSFGCRLEAEAVDRLGFVPVYLKVRCLHCLFGRGEMANC